MVKAGDPDTVDLCDGAVRMLFRRLPDLGDDVLRVVDPAKPNAMGHVVAMLHEECGEEVNLYPAGLN